MHNDKQGIYDLVCGNIFLILEVNAKKCICYVHKMYQILLL